MKLFNTVIAYRRADGTCKCRFTSQAQKKVATYDQSKYKTFRVFTGSKLMNKNDLINEVKSDAFFQSDADMLDALLRERSKNKQTSVADVLNAVKDTTLISQE